MFDKLIESNSAGAEFKPRRKFFMVSSVVVGIVFLSAVVVSLYAQDLDLGTDNFELTALLAPVAADAPEPPKPRQPKQIQPENTDRSKNELPSRPELIARIDQHQATPKEISNVPSRVPPMPLGDFNLDPTRPSSEGNAVYGGTPNGSGTGTPSGAGTEVAAETINIPEPPPVTKKAEAPKKLPPVSKGVVNGTAISLPKPPYPPAAKALGVMGEVNVQVLIDEQGNVVSAKAVSGHGTLRTEAERAAQKARFKPTLLSDQPVKVSGIIVYRFSK
jgi:protein TonB